MSLLLLFDGALSVVMCRGPSFVDEHRSLIVADQFDPPNLLLSTLAQQASMPFVAQDSGGVTRRVVIQQLDDYQVNILLLSPQPAASSNESPSIVPVASIGDTDWPLILGIPAAAPEPLPIGLQNPFDYRSVPGVVSSGSTFSHPLTLGIPPPPVITAMTRPAMFVNTVPRVVPDRFEPPNLLLSTLFAEPPATNPFVALQLDERVRTQRPVEVSNQGSLLGLYGITGWGPIIQEHDSGRVLRRITLVDQPPNLLVSTLSQPPQAQPIGLQDIFEYRPVPKVISSGSTHSHPLTLGIPAVVVSPPFKSPPQDEQPRARRPIAPQNQGSLLGLYGITGWGPVIQEHDNGKVLRCIVHVELNQPPNLLLSTLASLSGVVGLAVETDIAFPVTARKTEAVQLVVETDIAFALTASKTLTVNLTTEADVALAVSRVKTKAVGLPIEIDIALPLFIEGMSLAHGALHIGRGIWIDDMRR